MRTLGRWFIFLPVLILVGMFSISVLAVDLSDTTMQLNISTLEQQAINVQPIRWIKVPKSGPVRPSAVIITWDGTRWNAFSDHTGPFGCQVVQHEQKSLMEVCHGAVYDLSGRHIAGPPRNLYRYPVKEIPGWLEIDLGYPQAVRVLRSPAPSIPYASPNPSSEP